MADLLYYKVKFAVNTDSLHAAETCGKIKQLEKHKEGGSNPAVV